jgi:hypothetical protein
LHRQEEASVLVLAVLIPAAVIGLVVWIIVGMRQRAAEPFTLASATAFYAHVMVILTATVALCGGVLLVKVVFGLINMSYSYSVGFFSPSTSNLCPSGVPASACNPSPQPDFTPQRTQDLVLGLTLIVVGVAVAIAHRALARALRGLPGGRPVWVERGAAVAFTALYGFGAIFGLIAGASALISYFVVPGSSSVGPSNTFPIASGGQPFGDLVGTAIVFIPAWVVASLSLRRSLRASALLPPATGEVTP